MLGKHIANKTLHNLNMKRIEELLAGLNDDLVIQKKEITFNDIAEARQKMQYKTLCGGSILIVESTYGTYVRVWDSNDEIITTEFVSKNGYTLKEGE